MLESFRRGILLLALGSATLIQIACGSDGGTTQPKAAGGLAIVIRGHGNSRDADGFTVSVDGAQRSASYDSPVTFESLSPAQHSVRLAGVATHCFALADSVAGQVTASVTDTVTFDVSCVGGFVYHVLTSATDGQIVHLGADGRTTTVTTGPGRRLVESWSPDGTRLVFSNDASGAMQLFTVRLDGSDLVTLTSGPGMNAGARWSPDGSQIAFTHYDTNNGGMWIVLVNADGSNRRVLMDSTHNDFDPVWSADGTRLYFSCNRFALGMDLCSSSLDGSDVQPIRFAAITALPVTSTPQKWEVSPDGRSITFETLGTSSEGSQSAWVGALDGSSATKLSSSTSFRARWSPRSDRLVVRTWNGQANYGLATVHPDGTAFQSISNFADNDDAPSWSTDEAAIIFESRHTGVRQIWVMNADGTGRHALTSGSDAKYSPIFSPTAAPVGTLVGSSAMIPTRRSAPAPE